MVGIVIVSHSKNLALGVQELVLQMVQGKVNLALAAGIDDPENPFGTDAMQVYAAIESVYCEDGVVILMDLGSAVMSAEMALEFLPEEKQKKVKLCEAPLVEGAIAAAVQAAAGANLERVLAEAKGALAAKISQLSPAESFATPPICTDEQPTAQISLTVQNLMGLHARPAAKFVATASQFKAELTVQNVTTRSKIVNAKSISQIMALGVRQNHEMIVTAAGCDATEALAALQQLCLDRFGEGQVQEAKQQVTNSVKTITDNFSYFKGIPVSPGIAMAPVITAHLTRKQLQPQPTENPLQEWEQLQAAIHTARDRIKHLRQQTALQVGHEEAAIFEAHLLCLDDPEILEGTRQLIFEQNITAASAWQSAIALAVQQCEALSDSYLQARAIDIRDVGERVLEILTGKTAVSLDLSEPGILIADDLTPSQTALLDVTKVLGICTARGSATAHAAILARAIGIPAVMGLGENLLSLKNGDFIAMDGETGEVWLQPNQGKLEALTLKKERQQSTLQALKSFAQQPALTRDGHPLKVMANISRLTDAKILLENGAEGVGLLRSEFLYLERETAPTEDEQLAVYQEIATLISPHPVMIRVLDIGGDKPISYFNFPLEANPFLGWRGIRFLLETEELLRIQFRAILRASATQNLKVILPMVSSVQEVKKAKEILESIKAELQQKSLPFDDRLQVGIMVEIPAAVAMAAELAATVDFFSIGTNDLTQYVMACDRTNPKVAALADAFEPAVLRMIQQTIIAAHQANITVGICGELASSPLATPILLGMGVDELSMNPLAIPAVKATLSQLTRREAERIAGEVLEFDSAVTVKEYLDRLHCSWTDLGGNR